MAKSLAYIAERKAFEMTLNSIIKKSRNQDLASVMLPLVDKVEKIMGDDWEASSFEMLRNLANDPDSKWTHYTERILREVDPHSENISAQCRLRGRIQRVQNFM